MMRIFVLMMAVVGGVAQAQEASLRASPVAKEVSSSRFEALRTEVEGQMNASRVQVQQMLSCHANTTFWNGSSCLAPVVTPDVFENIESVVETTAHVSPDTCSMACEACDSRGYGKTLCNVRRVTSCSEFSLKPDAAMSGNTLNVVWKSCAGATNEFLPYRVTVGGCATTCTP